MGICVVYCSEVTIAPRVYWRVTTRLPFVRCGNVYYRVVETLSLMFALPRLKSTYLNLKQINISIEMVCAIILLANCIMLLLSQALFLPTYIVHLRFEFYYANP